MIRALHLLVACLPLVGAACALAPAPTAATAAVEAADRAYVSAWLSNDPQRILATLTDDAVLIPSGLPAIRGVTAIRGFWWPPDAPRSTVTAFTLEQDEAGVDGDLAFVRDTFALQFDYAGRSYANAGTYLSLLRRQRDGSWRISHRVWSDRPLPRE